MGAPTPLDEHATPVSRVIAEALVLRQGPRRIVTRAVNLGLSPMLTWALVVACGAAALDFDAVGAPRQQDE